MSDEEETQYFGETLQLPRAEESFSEDLEQTMEQTMDYGAILPHSTLEDVYPDNMDLTMDHGALLLGANTVRFNTPGRRVTISNDVAENVVSPLGPPATVNSPIPPIPVTPPAPPREKRYVGISTPAVEREYSEAMRQLSAVDLDLGVGDLGRSIGELERRRDSLRALIQEEKKKADRDAADLQELDEEVRRLERGNNERQFPHLAALTRIVLVPSPHVPRRPQSFTDIYVYGVINGALQNSNSTFVGDELHFGVSDVGDVCVVPNVRKLVLAPPERVSVRIVGFGGLPDQLEVDVDRNNPLLSVIDSVEGWASGTC